MVLWFARKTGVAITNHPEKPTSRMFAFSQNAKRAAFRFPYLVLPGDRESTILRL
jgi:hypothetical protein